MSKVKLEKEWTTIAAVYNANGDKGVGKRLDRFLSEEVKKIGNMIMAGDFDIRIGELGNRNVGEREIKRCSKDKVIGNGGRSLEEWVKDKGWHNRNGCTEGDWEGEYTYVGVRGCTVRLCFCKRGVE